MNRIATLRAIHRYHRTLPGVRGWPTSSAALAVMPLLVLTSTALAVGAWIQPWAWMSILAVVVYAGCKWLTWHGRPFGSRRRSLGYLLAWPGMDPPSAADAQSSDRPAIAEWICRPAAITSPTARRCRA